MRNKSRLLKLLTTCLAVLFLLASPASAKSSSAWKNAYKSFLEKGSFSFTRVYRRKTYYGKWYTEKTITDVKIEKFALVNIDGKGQPELIVLSELYPLDNKYFNQNMYSIYVARMKGKKVQVLPFGTAVYRKDFGSDRDYTNNVWGLGIRDYRSDDGSPFDYEYEFNMGKGSGIRYDSVNKALIIISPWKHNSSGKEPRYNYVLYLFYKLSGSRISQTGSMSVSGDGTITTGAPGSSAVPSYITGFKMDQTKPVKIYVNNKSNRKKVGQGKIKPIS